MKNKELVRYGNAWHIVKKLKLGGKVTNLLTKNKRKIDTGLNDFSSASKVLCEQYCIKDEKGNPIMKENEIKEKVFDFTPENQILADKEYEVLGNCECDIVLETLDIEPLMEQYSDISGEECDALYLLLTPEIKKVENKKDETVSTENPASEDKN